MPTARDCRQFHTVACGVSWETPFPPTPLDDVYNRDALVGRACPQPLPSSLDIRRGRWHMPAVGRTQMRCLSSHRPSPHAPPVTCMWGKTAH